MAIAPAKDRTIRLTKEGDLDFTSSKASGTTQTAQLTTGRNFANRFLPSTGVGGLVRRLTGVKTIILRGPTELSFSYASEIGEVNGLFTSFLQPWYIQNINITIRGQSYLGAYPIFSVPDRDVEDVLSKYRETLNDFTEAVGKVGDKNRFLLEVAGNPKGARKFLGYLRKLSWTENVKNAYMLDYTIDFIGRGVDDAKLTKGKDGASKDMRNAGSNG